MADGPRQGRAARLEWGQRGGGEGSGMADGPRQGRAAHLEWGQRGGGEQERGEVLRVRHGVHVRPHTLGQYVACGPRQAKQRASPTKYRD